MGLTSRQLLDLLLLLGFCKSNKVRTVLFCARFQNQNKTKQNKTKQSSLQKKEEEK
jgi:hypothetical protein